MVILGFQIGMTGTETQPYALLSPGRPGDWPATRPGIDLDQGERGLIEAIYRRQSMVAAMGSFPGGALVWRAIAIVLPVMAAREAARRKGYNVGEWSILVLVIPPLLLVLEMKRPLIDHPAYTNYVLEWAGSLIALLFTVAVLVTWIPAD